MNRNMRKMYTEEEVKNLIQKAINIEDIKLYEDVDIVSALEVTFGSLTGVSATKQFCNIRRTKENELYIVVNFSIKNNNESAVSLANQIVINVSVDSSISSKIYDVQGNSVHDALNSPVGITGITGFTDTGIVTAGFYSSKTIAVLNSPAVDVMGFQIREGGSIPAGATWNFTFRLFLTL